jgi:hypothetical protein
VEWAGIGPKPGDLTFAYVWLGRPWIGPLGSAYIRLGIPLCAEAEVQANAAAAALRGRWRRTNPKGKVRTMTASGGAAHQEGQSTAAPPRYRFRSPLVVVPACLAAAFVGAEVSWAATMGWASVFGPRAGYQPNSVGEWLYSDLFWGAVQLPFVLTNLVLVGWPALAVVNRLRPSWIGPRLVYCVGPFAVAIGSLIGAIGLFAAVGPSIRGAPGTSFLHTVMRATMMGVLEGLIQGLPAAITFRLIALRRT